MNRVCGFRRSTGVHCIGVALVMQVDDMWRSRPQKDGRMIINVLANLFDKFPMALSL